MDQYRNNYNDYQANNSSGDTWVYYNGELYHAGVKGMHWYQHMPGTDWWKSAQNAYGAAQRRENDRGTNGLFGKIRSGVHAIKTVAGQAKNVYGDYLKGEVAYYKNRIPEKFNNSKIGKLWNKGKGYSQEQIAKLSEFARQAYADARNSVRTYIAAAKGSSMRVKSDTPMSHLDEYQNKQMRDATKIYMDGKTDGSFGNTLNQWFQNAQYGIVKGVNNYLKKIAMDDEVDGFLSKITGRESNYTKSRRLNQQSANTNSYDTNLPSKQKDLQKQERERNARAQEYRYRAGQAIANQQSYKNDVADILSPRINRKTRR